MNVHTECRIKHCIRHLRHQQTCDNTPPEAFEEALLKAVRQAKLEATTAAEEARIKGIAKRLGDEAGSSSVDSSQRQAVAGSALAYRATWE